MKQLKREIKPSKDLAEEKQRTETNFDPNRDLRSDKWEKLGVNDLWAQRILLNSRIATVEQLGSATIALQMRRSLMFLDALIEEKTQKESNIADQVVVRY